MTLEEFATAKLVRITSKKMGEISDEDFEGHEKFASKEELYRTYSGYYGKPITPESSVKIIRFKLL